MGERRGKGLQDLITPDLRVESRSSKAITRGHLDTVNKQMKKNTPALCKSFSSPVSEGQAGEHRGYNR